MQVLAIDARNHGLSPKSPEHNYDVLAADLKALYDHLGINKAALIGHSMGGRVMINFALKYVRKGFLIPRKFSPEPPSLSLPFSPN